jgi:predicted DNA-binding transcriptional regulator AlpA
MSRVFVQAPEVAKLIGLASAAALLVKREKMEREYLFPLPMPHQSRPLIWKADEVQAWVDRHGRAGRVGIDPADIASGKVALMDKARSA